MIEDEVFAIETFPTTGNGEIYECKECNHFMIESKNKLSKNISDQIQIIINTRDTLAFCPRWFDFPIPDSSIITKYPVLKTVDGGIVAQYEKTIYIKNNGIEVLN